MQYKRTLNLFEGMLKLIVRAINSAGRVSPSRGESRGFEPYIAHQHKPNSNTPRRTFLYFCLNKNVINSLKNENLIDKTNKMIYKLKWIGTKLITN